MDKYTLKGGQETPGWTGNPWVDRWTMVGQVYWVDWVDWWTQGGLGGLGGLRVD